MAFGVHLGEKNVKIRTRVGGSGNRTVFTLFVRCQRRIRCPSGRKKFENRQQVSLVIDSDPIRRSILWVRKSLSRSSVPRNKEEEGKHKDFLN